MVVTYLNMTITTNERGQNNMWAKEPRMYVAQADAVAYAQQTYAEKAELANGRWAMMGWIALVLSYVTTGQIIPGVF